MQKTTNYQLNQWEPSDPIRREDFNADNAAIDAAIKSAEDKAAQANTMAGAAQNTAQAAASMATKAQAAADLVAADTMEQLLRVGYDLYQNTARSICAGAAAGTMKSAVFNSLTSADELSRMSGMDPLDGGGCAIGPSTAPTLDDLNAGITNWLNGEAAGIADAATAYVVFNSKFRGTITSLDVWYHRTCVTDTGQLPLYVKLYDAETRKYVYQSVKLTGAVMTNVDTAETLSVSIPVKANRTYQLELYTSGDLFTGTIGFGVYGTQKLTGTAVGTAATAGTVQESLALESPAVRAVAVIHYSGGVEPAAQIGGESMTVTQIRDGVSARGTACTEVEYRLSGEWSGTVALTAEFQGEEQDQTIHDVLFYLI